MLYHFFELFDFQLPGGRLWTYISFRAGVAMILSLFLSTIIGKRIIDSLRRHQIGETVRH